MRRYLLAIAATLLAVAPASAQWVGTPAANTPNPVNTNGGISFTMCWDGSAWDPCSTSGGGGSFNGVLLDAAAGDAITDTANNALRVNVVAGAGSGGTALADDADFTAGTTSFTPFGGFYQSTVTACTDGDTCAAGITTGRAVKVALANADGSLATYAADVTEDAAETAGGAGPMVLSVRRDTLASSAGTSGDNATFNTSSVGALYVQPVAGTSGGADSLKRNSVGTTEDEHEVKGSAGILYSVTVTNTNAAVRYLRCANQVIGSTTPGTTTPIIDLAIPGATTGAGITFPFPVGLGFSTGLTCWFVTGAADTDVAEVAANEIKALYTFK